MLAATVRCLHHEDLYSLFEEFVLYYQGSGKPLEIGRVCVCVKTFIFDIAILFCFGFSLQNRFSEVELPGQRGETL